MPDCSKQHTAQFGVINRSHGTIVVGWIQGKCDIQGIPAGLGYSMDTGNLRLPDAPNPGQSAVFNDLCRDLGVLIPVTYGELAVKVRDRNGKEQDFRQQIDHSPPGQYHTFWTAFIYELKVLNFEGEVEDGFALSITPFMRFSEE